MLLGMERVKVVNEGAVGCSYDSDDEEPEKSQIHLLDWRIEAKSDWTLEIVAVGKEDTAYGSTSSGLYHIHKNILAVGGKRGEYFVNLFQNRPTGSCKTTSKMNHTKIRLVHEAANAFPVLLDFMYSKDDELKITCHNAAALYYLGRFFRMRRLRWEAKQFWRKNLTVRNCFLYYKHGIALQEAKIVKAVTRECISNLSAIKHNWEIIKESDTSLWLSIVQDYDRCYADDSQHLSVLVTCVCKRHYDSLDLETFSKLTDEKYLPKIHYQAAGHLLEIAKAIGFTSYDETRLSSLQIRCLDSLA